MNDNIEKLIFDTDVLIYKIDELTKPDNSQQLDELKKKINIFSQRSKRMKEEFASLTENNNELKSFSDINWMSLISVPYDNAVDLLTTWSTNGMTMHTRKDKPGAMVKFVFNFLEAREKQLHSKQLETTVQYENN